MSELARKLQLKPGQRIVVLGLPDGVEVDLAAEHTTSGDSSADGVLAFAHDAAHLQTTCEPVIDAAARDALAWIAYPKGGQLGTDVSRDRLSSALRTRGLQRVRQIAVDDVWSALSPFAGGFRR